MFCGVIKQGRVVASEPPAGVACPVGRAWTSGKECEPCTKFFALRLNVSCGPTRRHADESWLRTSAAQGKSCTAESLPCVKCSGGDSITVHAGWQLYTGGIAAGVAAVLQCPNAEACMQRSYRASGTAATFAPNASSGLCNAKLGFGGLLCATCAPSTHFRSGPHRCKPCDAVSEAVGFGLLAVLVLVLLGGGALVGHWALHRESRGRGGEKGGGILDVEHI